MGGYRIYKNGQATIHRIDRSIVLLVETRGHGPSSGPFKFDDPPSLVPIHVVCGHVRQCVSTLILHIIALHFLLGPLILVFYTTKLFGGHSSGPILIENDSEVGRILKPSIGTYV